MKQQVTSEEFLSELEAVRSTPKKRWRTGSAARSEDRRKKCYREYWAALADGTLVRPSQCSSCEGQTNGCELDGHHEDYDKPLMVIWLCRKCHRDLHVARGEF